MAPRGEGARPAAPASRGLAPVMVTFAVAADGSVTATYEHTTSAGTATSRTVFSPATGRQSIRPPSPVPAASPG